MTESSAPFALPLFPLKSVLFPGGLLSLKVFEARYLDLVGECLRERKPFGVVALNQGNEVRDAAAGAAATVAFEPVGCLAELIEVDSVSAGILQVRCRGTQRFRSAHCAEQPNHLWTAVASLLPVDEGIAPEPALRGSVQGLENAIAMLEQRGSPPFLTPYRFDDAGWVANRWCEILPIPLAAKQKLMELDDPQVRLRLVDDFLRSKGVVS